MMDHPRLRNAWLACRPLGAIAACSGHFEGLTGLFHQAPGALQHCEGRVPFIRATDLRLDTERVERPPYADPGQPFLLDAQLRAAPIVLAGDRSMSRSVRRVIAVQQVKLHAAGLPLPGAHPARVSRQRDLHPQPLPIWPAQRRDRQLSRIVIREESLLLSVSADRLAKIPLLVKTWLRTRSSSASSLQGALATRRCSDCRIG